MNLYVVFLFLFMVGTFQGSSLLEEGSALTVELTPQEVDLYPGEKLELQLRVINTTESAIFAKSVKGKVTYESLGITLHTETLKWETELPPLSFNEEEKTTTLPSYAPPGVYHVYIWVEYEGGETEPAVCVLHYHNQKFYLYSVVAVVAGIALVWVLFTYGKRCEKVLPYVEKYPLLVGIALLVFSLYLFLHMHSWPASPDERKYLVWSFNIFKFGKYMGIGGVPVLKVPPVHCLLTALAFKIGGPSVRAAQAVNIFFGILCPPLAFFMGKQFYNTKVGILSGVLTATSFLIWSYSNRALSEIELTFFVNISLLLLYMILERSTIKYHVLLGVSLGIGYLVKEVIIFLLPLLLLILLEKNSELKHRIRNFFITVSVFVVVLIPWHYYVYAVSGSIFGGVMQRKTVEFTLETGILSSWVFKGWEDLVSILMYHGNVSVPVLVVFYCGIAWALYRYWTHRKRSDKLLLLGIAVWFFFLIFYKYMTFPVRRFIPMLIPLYILGSRVTIDIYEKVKTKKPQKFILAAFIIFIVVLSFCNTKKNARELAEFRFFSLYQEPAEDNVLKELPQIGCSEFLSVYDEDEVVGSILVHLFYIYTEGTYECHLLEMKKVSEMDENALFMYNPEKGFTEEGLLTQIYDKKITVVVLFDQYRITGLVHYLRSTNIFTESSIQYSGLYVFEVDRKKLEEYFES